MDLPAAGVPRPAPLVWPSESVWTTVAPWLPGFTVEVLPEIDSTNSELMRRARAGRTEPVLLVAERQTAGRGRLGRDWQGARGDSLAFSLGLPLAPADWSGLSLAVGVAVVAGLPAGIGLKWPNDLWWRDRKLGGILVETAGGAGPRQVIIGVGLNLTPPEADGLRTPPAGLRELDATLDAPTVLARVAPAVVRAVLDFASRGFGPCRARFEALDVLRGRELVLSDGTTGTGQGVAADGALQLRTAAGLRLVHSDEVSVRPTAAGTGG